MTWPGASVHFTTSNWVLAYPSPRRFPYHIHRGIRQTRCPDTWLANLATASHRTFLCSLVSIPLWYKKLIRGIQRVWLTCITTCLAARHLGHVVFRSATGPGKCYRRAKCKLRKLRSRNAMLRRTRPLPVDQCRRRGRVLCLLPNLLHRFRRRQSQICLHSFPICRTADTPTPTQILTWKIKNMNIRKERESESGEVFKGNGTRINRFKYAVDLSCRALTEPQSALSAAFSCLYSQSRCCLDGPPRRTNTLTHWVKDVVAWLLSSQRQWDRDRARRPLFPPAALLFLLLFCWRLSIQQVPLEGACRNEAKRGRNGGGEDRNGGGEGGIEFSKKILSWSLSPFLRSELTKSASKTEGVLVREALRK